MKALLKAKKRRYEDALSDGKTDKFCADKQKAREDNMLSEIRLKSKKVSVSLCSSQSILLDELIWDEKNFLECLKH